MSFTQEQEDEVTRLIREREAERERQRQMREARRLGKSGQPNSGLVDAPDVEIEG